MGVRIGMGNRNNQKIIRRKIWGSGLVKTGN